jgi:hypothetical protein
MTRGSIREYAAAVRERYRRADKRAKGAILDEFCRTTGSHRNAAARLLRRVPGPGPAARRRGRPRVYGPVVAEALRRVWEASGRLCGKRLAPFLPELVGLLERQGEVALPPPVRAQVVGLSAATADRLLRAPRARDGAAGRRPWAASPATAALRAQVPVRTAAEWAAVAPGECQADLVLHCGETTQGFYLTTLVTVDVASGWTELEAVWGKGMQRVGAAVHETRRRLPVPLRALHTDNGGEFLNELLVPYCRRVGVRLTRGRPSRKNDQAHVEQKNGAVVRRLVGYDRFASKAAFAQLQRLYGLVRLYVNFLQPVRKLVAKERVGAKVRKRFDTARTPYQRLLTTGQLDEATAAALAQRYAVLNPVTLRTDLDAALAALWRLAERPGPPAETSERGSRPRRNEERPGRRREPDF